MCYSKICIAKGKALGTEAAKKREVRPQAIWVYRQSVKLWELNWVQAHRETSPTYCTLLMEFTLKNTMELLGQYLSPHSTWSQTISCIKIMRLWVIHNLHRRPRHHLSTPCGKPSFSSPHLHTEISRAQILSASLSPSLSARSPQSQESRCSFNITYSVVLCLPNIKSAPSRKMCVISEFQRIISNSRLPHIKFDPLHNLNRLSFSNHTNFLSDTRSQV